MKSVNIKLKVPVNITKEANGIYVAQTPAFEIATQGKTIKQVRERFEELVSLFIEELVDTNKLDEALISLGWLKKDSSWCPPKSVEVNHQYVPISVPAENVLRDA